MKKIINGKVYETEKARLIGEWTNTDDVRVFSWYQEQLYRKRTGEFFLYGEGGPASPYRRAVSQNSWTGGEEIRPLTAEEARQWSESHMDPDAYEAEFGEITEDDSRVHVSVTLPRDLLEQLRRDASSAGVNLSALVESRLRA